MKVRKFRGAPTYQRIPPRTLNSVAVTLSQKFSRSLDSSSKKLVIPRQRNYLSPEAISDENRKRRLGRKSGLRGLSLARTDEVSGLWTGKQSRGDGSEQKMKSLSVGVSVQDWSEDDN